MLTGNVERAHFTFWTFEMSNWEYSFGSQELYSRQSMEFLWRFKEREDLLFPYLYDRRASMRQAALRVLGEHGTTELILVLGISGPTTAQKQIEAALPLYGPADRAVAEAAIERILHPRPVDEILWTADDPVQPGSAWRAVGDSFLQRRATAQGNWQAFTDDLPKLDLNYVRAAAIAFGSNHVWVATDHGLLSWERTTSAWRQLSLPAFGRRAPIAGLSLQDGTLVVLVSADGASHELWYDVATSRWLNE